MASKSVLKMPHVACACCECTLLMPRCVIFITNVTLPYALFAPSMLRMHISHAPICPNMPFSCSTMTFPMPHVHYPMAFCTSWSYALCPLTLWPVSCVHVETKNIICILDLKSLSRIPKVLSPGKGRRDPEGFTITMSNKE